MSSGRSQEQLDGRWDMHTERQIAASKAGITAITVLNSGSWLALLSQADKLASFENAETVSRVIAFWGFGAFFGTLPWLFVYLNTIFLALHDYDRESRLNNWGLIWTRGAGLASVFASLFCFAAGVIALSGAIGASK